MCRIFGFRSVIQSQVHRSLVSAENALAVQSQDHPDGWGVAYYLADAPHLIKGISQAVEDHIFQRVSGIVASETVVAHVRKATTGEVNILNAHPFQFGKWVFAHNGQIANFEAVREALIDEVAPNLRRYILGDTDSEILFYHLLSNLAQRADIHRRGTPVAALAEALMETINRVRELADTGGDDGFSKLTVLATDGHTMAALRSGMPLHFSTYKTQCFDRDTCPYLAPECEAPTETGFVNHMILSSEPLQGDNIWIEMKDGDVVGVDWRMKLFRGQIAAPRLVDLASAEV